ncbi:rCG46340 [Rattus norvegicus]|uniref:RCG46340 n=1 Tax=Rattus norvegicus TaxID=10116 RepID=A6IDF9_RAT|nr:rCG46340 [Rattus norvegicus]
MSTRIMEIMKTLGLSRQIYQHYRRLYCLPIRRGSSQTEITQNSKLKNTPLKPAQKVPTEYILTEVNGVILKCAYNIHKHLSYPR